MIFSMYFLFQTCYIYIYGKCMLYLLLILFFSSNNITEGLQLDKKIEAFESNLNKLENDLIMEINNLKSEEKNIIVNEIQDYNTFTDENNIDIINAKEIIKNDSSNSVRQESQT